jgi:hypothetical protein
MHPDLLCVCYSSWCYLFQIKNMKVASGSSNRFDLNLYTLTVLKMSTRKQPKYQSMDYSTRSTCRSESGHSRSAVHMNGWLVVITTVHRDFISSELLLLTVWYVTPSLGRSWASGLLSATNSSMPPLLRLRWQLYLGPSTASFTHEVILLRLHQSNTKRQS